MMVSRDVGCAHVVCRFVEIFILVLVSSGFPGSADAIVNR